MNKRDAKEIFFYFSLIFIMIMSLGLAVKDYVGMEITMPRMIIIFLSVIAVVSAFVLFPKLFFMIAALGICLLFYIYHNEPEFYLEKTRDFFIWLSGYFGRYNYFEQDYFLPFIILYATFFAIFISVVAYSEKGGFALIVTGTAILSFFWFVYVSNARLYLTLFLFGALMLYSYQKYKKKMKEWRSEGSIIEHGGGNIWALSSAIVITISLTLSLIFSLNIGQLKWPWLNDRIVTIFPFISEWRNDAMESFNYGYNSRYSLNSSGYRGNRLGGRIRQDSSVLMTVRTAGEETLYLRGMIMDRYGNNSWGKSKRKLSEYTPGQLMPLPYGSTIDTYEKTLEVTHKKLLTSTVFAPYSVHGVQLDIKRVYLDEDSEAYASKMIMKDKSYSVRSIMAYTDIEGLRRAKTTGMKTEGIRLYTFLTGDISERVRSLALEITGPCSNNYDKAKAVEKYLRQTYKYTLVPPEIPAGSEFTDHFLFEGREGYCTYFATSMTVLLRASGVPCRYVEGFISRYENERVREVKGTDAHAWVEVYFDDYGWVTFEPTPQYPEIEFAAPLSKTVTVEADTVQETVLKDSVTKRKSRDGRESDLEREGAGDAVILGKKGPSGVFFNILIFVFFILAARIAFMRLVQIIKEAAIRRSKGRKYAAGYLENMLWYLEHAGFVIRDGETLREFLKRVNNNSGENLSDLPMAEVLLGKIRYGGCEPSAEERLTLEMFRKNVKSFAMKKAGAFRFFIGSYILGRRV